IPFVLKGMVEAGEKQAKEQHATRAGNGDQAAAPPDPAPRSETANKAQTKPSAGMVAFAFLLVFAFALATPFLGGASNFMGLLIHSETLKRLAAEGEAAERDGDHGGALGAWRQVLALLPAGSVQHARIEEKVQALSGVVTVAPRSAIAGGAAGASAGGAEATG